MCSCSKLSIPFILPMCYYGIGWIMLAIPPLSGMVKE